MSARFHRAVYRVHLWMGLVSGLLMLLVSVTGAVLVFADELDALLYPHLLRVEPREQRASFDQMFATVKAAYPGATLYGFRMLPEEPGHSYTVNMDLEGRYWFAHVNPYDGTLVGDQDADRGLIRVLLKLHYSLMSGLPGEVVVFLLGVTLGGGVLTGTWVYRKSLLHVFRAPTRWGEGARAVASDLHHKVGVAALLFNLLIAITGGVMLWPSVAGLWRTQAPAAASVPLAGPEVSASLDAMVAQAPVALPGFVLKGLYLPSAAGEPVTLYGYVRGANPLLGTYGTKLEFEPDGSGALRQVKDARAAPLLERLHIMSGPLHFGNWGGLPIKLLYTLLGLTPGALSVTGFLMWWVKRQRRKPATQGKAELPARQVPGATSTPGESASASVG